MQGDNPKGWLLAIVRNCHACAAEQRTRHLHLPISEEIESQVLPEAQAEMTAPESESMGCDKRRFVERFLAAMAEEHLEVLVSREIEGLEYREIAAIVNVPIGTVMSRFARARAALKTLGQQACAGDVRAVL